MSYLAVFASFEDLCYGSTAIRHIIVLIPRTDFRRQKSMHVRRWRLKLNLALNGLTTLLIKEKNLIDII